MQTELMEHAIRVLERTAGRSMSADLLYARISSEAGLQVGVSGLLDCARDAADRFVVLPPAAAVLDEADWAAGERAPYAVAMAAAGLSSAPTIMLAERTRHAAVAGATPDVAGSAAASSADAEPGPGSVLAELHAAVSELLRASGEDPELQRRVSGALASLRDVERQLDGTS